MKKPTLPKPPPPKPDYLPACRKLGRAVRFSFLRIIRRAFECDEAAAIVEFEKAVNAGKIRRAGANGAGDVSFFEA